MMGFIKKYGLSLLLLIAVIFCLFNIAQNIQDAFTVITNSLAIFLAILYFINFEKENIKKIRWFILHIKWPFHGQTKKTLGNIIKFIIKKRWEIISYLFLFLLIIITLSQFSYLDKFINLNWINKYQVILTVLAILTGGLTFWHNRGRIETKLEIEKDDETKKEKQRALEFPDKYPKINKIPVLNKIAKKIYINGFNHSLSFFFIIIVFILIQIYQIFHTRIGTDEGNFLYTVKLLLQGKKLFIDFWSRESGSLLFLIPWFKFFSVSIINLRVLVFLIHIIILYTTIKIINCFELNKNQNLLSIVLIVAIYLTKELNFYAGIFYQIFNLLTIVTIYFLIKFYRTKSLNYRTIVLLGLITGINCLVYRGGVGVFTLTLFTLLTTFFIRNLTNCEAFIKKIVAYIVSTTIPILIYWIYYAKNTSYAHIHKIIIGGYFEQILPIGILMLIGFVIFVKIKPINRLIKNFDLHIILYSAFLYCSYIYLIIKNPDFFKLFYAGIFFNTIFIIFPIQTLSLYLLKSLKLKRLLFYLFVISNTFIFYRGYEFRGYYTKIDNVYYLLSILIFIVYLSILFLLTKHKFGQKLTEKLKIILILLNANYIIFILGGALTSDRFQANLVLTSLIILSVLIIKINNSYWLPKLFIISSLIFFIYTNLKLPNDYTLYSLKNYRGALLKINEYIDKNSTVFSADTSILSEIENKNTIAFHSPFHFRESRDLYFYNGIEKIDTDISLTKEKMINKIENETPDYIIGCWRSTLRIFQDPLWNIYLSNNYTLKDKIGRIYIYSKNKNIK